MRAVAGFVLAAVLTAVQPAAADLIAPFKDRLFALPETLETSDGGARRVVDYREMRDINGRDAIPERRVHREYVDLAVREHQRDLIAATDAERIGHFAVGRAEGADFIVAYLHGQGGSRHQGVDDFTFGGNFNRIKNLAWRNGGLYLSPDFSDFGEAGAGQVAALLSLYIERADAGAPVYLACGSAGGALCWALADDQRIAPHLGGLLLLGSHWSPGFLQSLAFARRVPVYLGHGGRDTVFPVERQRAFFRSILDAASDYPARLVEFAGGTHGTPIRMTDWRAVLNWMAAN